MPEQSDYDYRILSVKQTIENVVIGELNTLIYKGGTPFIKFLLLPSVIEYLGACLDNFPFNNEEHSEDRFNDALKKLFPIKYKSFAEKGSIHYLYKGYRCNMVHRMVPKGFALSTRKDAIEDGNKHLKVSLSDNRVIILVLEDFCDDIVKAAKKLIKMYDQGKAPKAKGDEGQLKITSKKKILL